MRVLWIFDSAWTLVALCAVGAVVGVAVAAAGDGGTGPGVAAGLGAVAGIAVHYLGVVLMWTWALCSASGAAWRASRRG